MNECNWPEKIPRLRIFVMSSDYLRKKRLSIRALKNPCVWQDPASSFGPDHRYDLFGPKPITTKALTTLFLAPVRSPNMR